MHRLLDHAIGRALCIFGAATTGLSATADIAIEQVFEFKAHPVSTLMREASNLIQAGEYQRTLCSAKETAIFSADANIRTRATR